MRDDYYYKDKIDIFKDNTNNNNIIINNKYEKKDYTYFSYGRLNDLTAIEASIKDFSLRELELLKALITAGINVKNSITIVREVAKANINITPSFITQFTQKYVLSRTSIPTQTTTIPAIKNININNTPANRTQAVSTLKNEVENKNNEKIKAFLSDIFDKSANRTFRGWILPNGQLMSQYVDDIRRQDHRKLAELFINGLEEYDKPLFAQANQLLSVYCIANYNVCEPYESFAVEVLGWIQASEFGSKRLICRGERWQDKLIDPFINQYGFEFVVVDSFPCYEHLFKKAIDDITTVIELGLQKKYDDGKIR